MSVLINKLYRRYKYIQRRYFSFLGRFGKKPNQYFIVSFPKSGNTWMRIMFSNLLSIQEDGNIFLQEIQEFVPDSHVPDQLKRAEKKGSLFEGLRFQFIKSHDPYKKFFKGKNVIYIVRDGRDVLNSYYHYINARREGGVKMMDLIERGEQLGFGSWNDHVMSWHNGRHGRFILLRYEDLLRDTENEMKKLLNYIGFEVKESALKLAIENSSFDRLRSLEDKKGVAYADRLKDKSSKFFRKGTSGDWKSAFTPEELKRFEELNREAMQLCGYEPANPLGTPDTK